MRGRAIQFAKSKPKLALLEAKKEKSPWFKAQALSYCLRYSEEPLLIAKLAKSAAKNGKDKYQQSAVRAWEIAALAQRGYMQEAKKSLREACDMASQVSFAGSRAEAFHLLLNASFSINLRTAQQTYERLQQYCKIDGHWRCKRALRNARLLFEEPNSYNRFYY